MPWGVGTRSHEVLTCYSSSVAGVLGLRGQENSWSCLSESSIKKKKKKKKGEFPILALMSRTGLVARPILYSELRLAAPYPCVAFKFS